MASSGSTRDLIKALNGFLQAPALPLPAELVTVISSYLEKHAKFDEGAAERLNDELLSVYEKTVQERPEKYATFLVILRELRPAFRTAARTFEWWDRLLDPVLEFVEQEKGLAREVLNHTLDLLLIDESDGPAPWNEPGLAPFTDRLLSRYMSVREEAQAHAMSSSVELKERMIKETLLIFGKKDPKGFMTSLDSFVLRRDYRNNALSLLCDFVASQPPHLHLILQTPLFINILHSLQKDESTSTVTLALVSLIMLLPFMPSSLVPSLPTLFNIYARLLFWDRDTYFAQAHTEIGIEDESADPGMAWEKCLLDPDHDGSSIHYLSTYFTILYGLYPINFVDYIRKPQRYLRHANNDEDIDVQAMEIRDRSERFRKQHLLHPNFYNLTIESEKTDLSRWIKSEADEVLADCMALSIPVEIKSIDAHGTTRHPGAAHSSSVAEEADREGFEAALLNGSSYADTPSLRAASSSVNLPQQAVSVEFSMGGRESIKSGRRGSQSSHPSARDSLDNRPREIGGDSPTLPPHFIHTSSPQVQLQDMIHSNKAIKSGLHQSLANDSVVSLVLSPQEPATENALLRAPQQPLGNLEKASAEPGDRTSLLYRQSLLLQNDLQFERYIKQQHMTHMGELRRKQIREAATEAETQNLVMANRSLKQRLDEAKRGEAQTRKEFEHRRNMAQKRENDLSTKLRSLREEQKKWSAEGIQLRQQLEKAQGECERLRRIIDEAEEKILVSEQSLEAVDISTGEIERLRAEIARLSASEHAFQGKEMKMQIAIREAEAERSRAEQWRMELVAREDQLREARKHYDVQIAALSNKLTEALRDNQRNRAGEASAVFEHALAASRAKQAELQKQYSALMRKYIVMQSSVLDIQCDTSERRGAGYDGGPSSFGVETESIPMAGSPIAPRNRVQRGFSDPEAFEGISHNATSPLEPVSTSLGSATQRPTTPLEPGLAEASQGGIAAGGKTSPQIERYFGRGGVQNAIRKDKKDDKAERKEKKEKKSGTGLRGIRNFV
ncbi:Hamartin protein-domain-containing protein [Lasiosphaeria hispida]|uniref:Hamartin protein-domain-containing protein n=1 Tax=Lasiosphaeria hispida TaxID=260671 RepID=A0AAJ0HI09_9PEZI|nr:Hamartin protein-domain-containing protein [Lasiosphaeria hispida]